MVMPPGLFPISSLVPHLVIEVVPKLQERFEFVLSLLQLEGYFFAGEIESIFWKMFESVVQLDLFKYCYYFLQGVFPFVL